MYATPSKYSKHNIIINHTEENIIPHLNLLQYSAGSLLSKWINSLA